VKANENGHEPIAIIKEIPANLSIFSGILNHALAKNKKK
jgi:hypothetical protein